MDMQSALNMGADDYVTKPFDRRELLARIRTRLRVKEAEDVIRRRNRELNLLPEIGKELSARLDIDELVDVVLRRTVETLGAFVGYLVLLSPEGSLQSTHHFSISSSPISEIKLPPLKYLLDKVKESRQGIIINDTRTDSRWQVSPDDPSRSVVIVPMFGRLNLLGLLILAHEQMEYFTMEHRLLLQAISSQAAIALENALLYKNAASQQEHLEGVLQSAPHPILMFDKSGCVLLANLEGEKLFSSIKLGEPLERGHGYDELLGLVENPLDPHVSGRKDISWPDGRNFLALRMPTESGGCTIVFQNAGG